MISYIVIIIAIISMLFFVVKTTSNKENKDTHPKQEFVNNKGYLLKDIDFSEGNYALYIRHKKYGRFIVLDEKALIQNKNKLKVKLSLINYLPGGGDRSYGVMLFKDNKLLTAKTGGAFTTFEIGDLMNFSTPVQMKSFQGVKREIRQKLDYIANDKQAFLMSGADFVPDNREYRFRVYFPSMAVPVTRKKDANGVKQITSVNGIDFNRWTTKEKFEFEKKWRRKIEKCIRQQIDSTTDVDIIIIANSLLDAYLFNDADDILSKDKHVLYINDYMFYNFEAYISTAKNEAEKLFELDYSNCLSEEDRKRPQVLTKMKALIKQSTHPNLSVEKGEIGLYQYKDRHTKYDEIYQQEYEIRWLEVKGKQ